MKSLLTIVLFFALAGGFAGGLTWLWFSISSLFVFLLAAIAFVIAFAQLFRLLDRWKAF